MPSSFPLRALAAAVVLLVSIALPVGAAHSQSAPAVFISEIHYDNAGTDSGEAIEMEGPAGADLTGYTLVARVATRTPVVPGPTGSLPGRRIGCADPSGPGHRVTPLA